MFSQLIELLRNCEPLEFSSLRSPSRTLIQRLSTPGGYHLVDGFGRSLYYGKTRCLADRLPVQLFGWGSEVIWNLSTRADRSDWYEKKAWLMHCGGHCQLVRIDRNQL
jgi:hypothetical protein